MTNSELFKAAHELTRVTMQQGDNYQLTFGMCLKTIKANQMDNYSIPKTTNTTKVLESIGTICCVLFVVVILGVLCGSLGYMSALAIGIPTDAGVLLGLVFSVVSTALLVAPNDQPKGLTQ